MAEMFVYLFKPGLVFRIPQRESLKIRGERMRLTLNHFKPFLSLDEWHQCCSLTVRETFSFTLRRSHKDLYAFKEPIEALMMMS